MEVHNIEQFQIRSTLTLGNEFNYEVNSIDAKQIVEGKKSKDFVLNIDSLNSGMYCSTISNDSYQPILKFVKL